jgi:hypothetical protein
MWADTGFSSARLGLESRRSGSPDFAGAVKSEVAPNFTTILV